MHFAELGYVVVNATDIEAWRVFGAEVLGAMPVDGPDGTLYLKMDERTARFVIQPSDSDGFAASGWGTLTEREFDEAREHLAASGVELAPATVEELRVRRVERMFRFLDPAGNTHEVYCGPAVDTVRFASPAGVREFVTGAMGMGHVVLPTGEAFDATEKFFTEVVGLEAANVRHFPRAGRDPLRIRFLHCNDRQHSLALGEIDAPSGCVHIALEVGSLDEVGRALDRAASHGVLARSLGKHINDSMVSFYLTSPGGFQIEYGYGDGDPTWTKGTYFVDTVGSYWGHTWVENANPLT